MAYNLNYGYPYFSYVLSGGIFMLLIAAPLLTMRSFAEERKNRTDQLLLTAPVSLFQIVMGKYLAMIPLTSNRLLEAMLLNVSIRFSSHKWLKAGSRKLLALLRIQFHLLRDSQSPRSDISPSSGSCARQPRLTTTVKMLFQIH